MALTTPSTLLRNYLKTIEDVQIQFYSDDTYAVEYIKIANRKEAKEFSAIRQQYIAAINALDLLFKSDNRFANLVKIDSKYWDNALAYVERHKKEEKAMIPSVQPSSKKV